MDVVALRERADSGSIAAQSILGISYLYGLDTEVDYQQAFRLLRAAADAGASRAVVNLGRMHAVGYGIEQDMAKAIRLYQAVAKVEFFAALELGRIYSRGIGVTADRDAALNWYSLALNWKDGAGDSEMSEQAAWASGVPRLQDIGEAESFVKGASPGTGS